MNAPMSPARRTVEEYTALLSRAFNGAIDVDGERIVAHPSGTLLTRSPRPTPVPPGMLPPGAELVWSADRDTDWSDL